MDNNFIVSICAIIIALASLAVTIWQGVIIRKHNILSVKPIPDILTSNFEDCAIKPFESKILLEFKLNLEDEGIKKNT
ncbi:MAG: hypothetical protein CO128_01155 [Ignavibacteriales bacterium CG_4_9_14_3_um_filter_30_11]|nr:MAG: hypothetical protein CO128_01155 [Ignavibacteriales bacterium CG_4_9_14_3_um_filter_30_11]